MNPLTKIATLSIFIFLIFFSISNASQTEDVASSCNSNIYDDEAYLNVSDKFNSYQKIYLKIECKDLEPGDYTINVHWIDSSGSLQRQSFHNFIVKQKQSYTSYFWLKLQPKGTLLQAISGDEFDQEQYGTWRVLTYINSLSISSEEFLINK